MFKTISNIGDSGVVCNFGEEVNEKVNSEVIKLFHFIKKKIFGWNNSGNKRLYSILQQANNQFRFKSHKL